MFRSCHLLCVCNEEWSYYKLLNVLYMKDVSMLTVSLLPFFAPCDALTLHVFTMWCSYTWDRLAHSWFPTIPNDSIAQLNQWRFDCLCSCDGLTARFRVNSTRGQLDTRVELTEVNSTPVSSWPKSKKTLFQIVYNESNRPIRSWIFFIFIR